METFSAHYKIYFVHISNHVGPLLEFVGCLSGICQLFISTLTHPDPLYSSGCFPSPWALLVHMIVFVCFSLSLWKVFAFSDDLSVHCIRSAVWIVMFEFAQNPLSLTQGSPIRNTSVSEAPSHLISDWVKISAHPTFLSKATSPANYQTSWFL